MASSTKTKRKKDKPKKQKHREPKAKKAKDGRKRDRRMNAKNADKYELYERAVNSPEADIDFLVDTYRALRDKDARRLREDFCGTGNLAAEWLRRNDANTAEGFDLDPEPIQWGKRRHFEALGDAAERMTFHEADVRTRANERPDITTAPNFSYWLFHQRAELLEYFRHVYEDLADDGIFVVDLYGGPESITEMEETRALGGGVEYVWDQKAYWPASGLYECAIHFRFRDGSELTNAFEYTWRLWGLPELRDVMLEAGFQNVGAYFEGTDPDDEEEGDGIFVLDEKGENIDAWIAYLVASK